MVGACMYTSIKLTTNQHQRNRALWSLMTPRELCLDDDLNNSNNLGDSKELFDQVQITVW